jgi:tetratricopeptide (TPR) repeat protein
MFTEDYLMRIINQAIAALMIAIGLRKAGKYSEALQAIQQAIEQLTTLPENIVDQMADGSILSMLVTQGQLDVGRLATLADLYQEQGEILIRLDQSVQGRIAFARALRFILEVPLSDAANLSADTFSKVEGLIQQLKGCPLPAETQVALSDYYWRLLEKDDQSLVAAGTSRKQVNQALAELQDQLGPSQKK